MFTGIVEEIGTVARINWTGRAPLVVRCRTVLEGTRLGDSIAVNGVCLTVAAGQRLGGHYVQGHVDGVGRLVSTIGEGPSVVIRFAVPPDLLRFVVERGFVAVDGASLTVMQLRPDGFDVSLVYHTQQTITLPQKRPGALVNIEVDVVGKYVERLAECPRNEGITLDLLRRSGFA